jgi:toxin FitB
LLVPTICITAVFKRVLQQRGEDAALHAVALMQQGNVVDLDSAIAIEAARLVYCLINKWYYQK